MNSTLGQAMLVYNITTGTFHIARTYVVDKIDAEGMLAATCRSLCQTVTW